MRGYLKSTGPSEVHMSDHSKSTLLRRVLALLLRRRGPSSRILGMTVGASEEARMDDETRNRNTGEQGIACRDARDESAVERARRERVREASERVRAENREILDRLATK
jgi:hypothetical protein